jgi:hypothetical protein
VIAESKQSLLLSASDDYTQARLLAVTAFHAGEWFNAPPLSSVGLRTSNDVIRVAACLRLGANLCAPTRAHVVPW